MPKSHAHYPAAFCQQMVDLVCVGRSPEALAREFKPTAQVIRVLFNFLAVGVLTGAVFAQSERSSSPLTTSEIARRVTPTVVTIETPAGYGSGVIVDPSGVVVTNLHVIQGETQVELTLHNGDIYDDVAVVDLDERRDLVLLKIKAFDVRYATFGNSDKVEVGEDVVLVGSPQGLDLTVSTGVISAIRDSGRGYRLLQTSAPASPGSSGGGMFNIYGELVGVVTSQTITGQNLNFAVPVNYVRGLMSAEATMTLADLTARAQSASGRNRERADYPSSADDISSLSSIIERMVAFEELDEILDLEDAGDGLWIATYKKVENLASVIIGIKLITDEFEKSLVWIRSELPETESNFTASQLKEILELNFRLNIAKAVLDDEGNIYTMAEAELRTLDSIGLLRIIYAVAYTADQVTGILNRTTNQVTVLRRSSRSGDTALNLLDGNTVVRYNPLAWIEVPQNDIDVDVDMLFRHHSGEVYIAIEANRMQIPVFNLPQRNLDDIREAFPNVLRIDDVNLGEQGIRNLNGIECIYWEHTATTDGTEFAYLNHGCNHSNGTIRIVGWTTPSLFEKHQSTILEFVAGLEISRP